MVYVSLVAFATNFPFLFFFSMVLFYVRGIFKNILRIGLVNKAGWRWVRIFSLSFGHAVFMCCKFLLLPGGEGLPEVSRSVYEHVIALVLCTG